MDDNEKTFLVAAGYFALAIGSFAAVLSLAFLSVAIVMDELPAFIDPDQRQSALIALLAALAAFGAINSAARRMLGSVIGPVVMTSPSGVGSFLGVLAMNVVAWMMAWGPLLAYAREGEYVGLYLGMLILSGFVLMALTAFKAATQGLFGPRARLDLETPRPQVGGPLRGSVVVSRAEPGETFRIELACVARQRIYDSTKSTDWNFWADEREVPALPAGSKFRLAFSFTIPTLDPPTGNALTPTSHRWVLRVHRSMSSGLAIPYQFPIPVVEAAELPDTSPWWKRFPFLKESP